MSDSGRGAGAPRVPLLHDPRFRGLLTQAVTAVVVVCLLWVAVDNAATNMRARGIPTNFDFWNRVSGFDINQTLISYSAVSTYGQAFQVGLLNTLLVAGVGIVFATLLGFTLGVMRLSSNWAARSFATVYVETLRNVPLLLQLLFWYNAILSPLPAPRASLAMPSVTLTWPDPASLALALGAGMVSIFAGRSARGQTPGSAGALVAPIVSALGWIVALLALIFGAPAFVGALGGGVLHWGGPAGVYLNNRGLLLPNPSFGPGSGWVLAALAAAVAASVVYTLHARRRQAATGAQSPVGLVSLALLVGLPLIAFVATGAPVTIDYPVLRGFNFQGGLRVNPEFVALLLGLVLYTASFIAEDVRAGVQSVAKGQSEAAHALGLRASPTLRLVVLPQALRVILPPLTNQYLNLTKNSSLAVFIGYPELVQVFMGTVLNQTGAAVQVIAVTMAVYLTISLATSGLMALYARHTPWAER